MADKSTIEWTDATWNPVRGCSRITTGCGGPNHEGGCYAEKIAARFSDPGQPFHGFAERTPHGGRWTGRLALIEDQLTLPLRWKKPRRIFVNSMSDLFHENLPDEAIDRVFAVMALAPQHTFQVLTKRAERMREYFAAISREMDADDWKGEPPKRFDQHAGSLGYSAWSFGGNGWPLPNVWLGVSAERQEEWDARIPHLMATPAALRFASCEPLLGPIEFSPCSGCNHPGPVIFWPCPNCKGRRFEVPDWIIVGGESGPKARPMHPQWARSLRDQCARSHVPFFYKQWGEWIHRDCVHVSRDHAVFNADGSCDVGVGSGTAVACLRTHVVMERIGKSRAGRLLDGREHNEFPVTHESLEVNARKEVQCA